MELDNLIDILLKLKADGYGHTGIILAESFDFLVEINIVKSSSATNGYLRREYIEFGFRDKSLI